MRKHVYELMRRDIATGETFYSKTQAEGLAAQLNAASHGRRPYWVKTHANPSYRSSDDPWSAALA